MFTRLVRQCVSAVICVGIMSVAVLAGDISGVVKYKNGGGSAAGVRISGMTAGAFGGMTKTVYSDKRGKFVLSWKSSGGLAKLYANGSVVAKDIRDGESVVVTVK